MALDEADLKKIVELLGAERTETDKRIGETLKSQIGALGLDKIGDTLKALGTDVTALKTTKVETVDEPADKGTKGKPDPATLALQAKVAEMDAALKAAKAKETESNRNAAIRAELAKAGIDAAAIDDALPLVLARIPHEIAEDGAVTWKIKQNGVDNVPVDTAAAMKSFATSDAGKRFTPPTGVNGAGDRGVQRVTTPGGVPVAKTADEFLKSLGVGATA